MYQRTPATISIVRSRGEVRSGEGRREEEGGGGKEEGERSRRRRWEEVERGREGRRRM